MKVIPEMPACVLYGDIGKGDVFRILGRPEIYVKCNERRQQLYLVCLSDWYRKTYHSG